MNLREVELFGTLMRVGTTIETARVLGISQAGVSAQLRRLETQIGFRLFFRAVNRLMPTSEAHRLFHEAAPIFATHSHMRDLLLNMANHAEAPVSVSATPAVVEGFLAPRLNSAGFKDWGHRLRLRVTDPEPDVREGFADLGIQMAVPPKAEFQSYRMAAVPMYAVVRGDHALAQRSTLQIVNIAQLKLVAYSPVTSPMGVAIRDAYVAQGFAYDPTCTVPFSSTVCQLVSQCGGIGIIDELTVHHLRDPGLCTIRVTDIPSIRIVVFHRREPLSAPVQDLLHQLIDA